MSVKFISGVLETIKTGAMYEGFIWNQWLTFCFAPNRRLSIFDPDYIGKDLTTGHEYQFVLYPTIFASMQIVEQMSEVEGETWYGVVRQMDWTAGEQVFKAADNHFFKSAQETQKTWCLVETAYGSLILSNYELRNELNRDVDAGTMLMWQASRWDLLAFV